MHKELELWKFAVEKLKRGETVMLLVVAESAGSSPGRQGFKMAVARGGGLAGSIGGGVMEVNLVESAKAILSGAKTRGHGDAGAGEQNPQSATRDPKSQILRRVHRENSPHASGMICSGKQTVIFFHLGAEELPAVRRAARSLEKNRGRILRISNLKFEISDNPAGGAARKFDFRFSQKGEGEFLYEEKLGYKNRLFIVGGGHCALALSELASKMDFYITLFDDRAGLSTVAKNRFVHEKKLIESYERIADFIEGGGDVYVVVMTLGYRSDETVIRKLCDRDFKYFGVLGSRAKMAALMKKLRGEGFDPERLARIRTPVGIPINSRTPEEIAVSIAAEMIMVKNEK